MPRWVSFDLFEEYKDTTRLRGRKIVKRGLVLTGVALGLILISSNGAFATSHTPWPMSVKSHLWGGQNEEKGPFAIDAKVSSTVLGAEGGVQFPSYFGNTGWATATLKNFLYPVVSHDHGDTWHVGGVYFAAPVAKSTDYVSRVKVFSPSIVAMYAQRSLTFDITSDAGHHWHQSLFPGLIESVTSLGRKSADFPEGVIEVTIKSEPNAPNRLGSYSSIDGGLTWKIQRAN
jgi:hypothetical protein